VADFACIEAKLVIELDGSQHAEAETYDARRTAEVEACGFLVLRFWNGDVLRDLDGVLTTIHSVLEPDAYGV
jgi:very-short-patch-repair endonuclease